MVTFIRQLPKKLRLWLITAAALLLLTSVLEAGHIHDVFTAADGSCTLCQHSVALDKILQGAHVTLVPALRAACSLGHVEFFTPYLPIDSPHIRAPPFQIHTIINSRI